MPTNSLAFFNPEPTSLLYCNSARLISPSLRGAFGFGGAFEPECLLIEIGGRVDVLHRQSDVADTCWHGMSPTWKTKALCHLQRTRGIASECCVMRQGIWRGNEGWCTRNCSRRGRFLRLSQPLFP